MHRYPHEATGGEKQRVVIATAFACRPELIIFDEPTTALDVITGARILDLFRRLRAETGVAALYISHDLALVSRVADRVAVIDRGRIVRNRRRPAASSPPRNPNTRALVAAVPRPDRRLVDRIAGAASRCSRSTISASATAARRLFGAAHGDGGRDGHAANPARRDPGHRRRERAPASPASRAR